MKKSFTGLGSVMLAFALGSASAAAEQGPGPLGVQAEGDAPAQILGFEAEDY